jgi:hypothetical protein
VGALEANLLLAIAQAQRMLNAASLLAQHPLERAFVRQQPTPVMGVVSYLDIVLGLQMSSVAFPLARLQRATEIASILQVAALEAALFLDIAPGRTILRYVIPISECNPCPLKLMNFSAV